MFHDTRFLSITALQNFLGEHSEALQNAGLLLAGKAGLRLAQSVIDECEMNRVASRRMVRNLQRLHDLLTLQNVHDASRIEWECFASIDPASPVVAQICLLADGLLKVTQEAGIAISLDEDITAAEIAESPYEQ